MEQNNFTEYKRIARIAHGKIPVSEDSPMFNLFAERRKIAQYISDSNLPGETNIFHVKKCLEEIEDRIKQYLWL